MALEYSFQRAKRVVSDSPGLVDFAIGLVIFVLNLPDGSLPADVLWGSFVRRNECVTNEPQRTSAGRLARWASAVFFLKFKTQKDCNQSC